VHSYAILPIGYLMSRFGTARRIPLVEVVYEDQWGQPYRHHQKGSEDYAGTAATRI
jgi:hypothetical protein